MLETSNVVPIVRDRSSRLIARAALVTARELEVAIYAHVQPPGANPHRGRNFNANEVGSILAPSFNAKQPHSGEMTVFALLPVAACKDRVLPIRLRSKLVADLVPLLFAANS